MSLRLEIWGIGGDHVDVVDHMSVPVRQISRREHLTLFHFIATLGTLRYLSRKPERNASFSHSDWKRRRRMSLDCLVCLPVPAACIQRVYCEVLRLLPTCRPSSPHPIPIPITFSSSTIPQLLEWPPNKVWGITKCPQMRAYCSDLLLQPTDSRPQSLDIAKRTTRPGVR